MLTSTTTRNRASVLLRVDSSPRPSGVTASLTEVFADEWSAARPGAEVIRHDLASLNLPHLNTTEMGAWFAEPDEHTDLHHLVLARSNGLIDDVLRADEIVIGAPMWNFSIPSSLKAWIDHITKAGRTIAIGPDGAVGLVGARRTVVISSRGSDYRPGTPIQSLDLQEPYLRLILGFLGIGEVVVVNVDGQGPNHPDAADRVTEARSTLVDLAQAAA